jgi:hypothetical protein
MEVEVIDDADKSEKQQANGRRKKTLLKRGQEGMDVHLDTGTVAHWGSRIYIWHRVYGGSVTPDHIRQLQL